MSTKEAANRILKGQETLDSLLGHLQGKIFFQDKSLKEWKEYFSIEMPSDLDTISCKNLGAKLLALYQEASFFLAWADIRQRIAKSASEETVANAYLKLIESYRSKGAKLPAAATLDNEARASSSEMINAQTLTEIESSFWKRIIGQLEYNRKIVENATMNIAVERKGLKEQL